MKLKRAKLLIFTGSMAVILGCALFYLVSRDVQTKPEKRAPGGTDTGKPRADGTAGIKSTPDPERNAKAEIRQLLDRAVADIEQAGGPEEARKVLGALRAALGRFPPEAAAFEVRSFLDAGKDAVTRLDLTILPGGGIGDSPSLRVFMMDYLSQVDPEAAAAIAREVMAVPGSPDEWAVSMRNLARFDSTPAAREFLTAKGLELITNREWQKNPSAGYLEAFDVIVYLRAGGLVPQLGELVKDRGNRAVAHAAFLTLDRLAMADPVQTLNRLEANPETMRGREKTRANIFARTDLRDTEQRRVLESYLLDARRTPEEIETFAQIFPNANYMISNNLLTSAVTPRHAELVEKDRASLEVVQAWLADPRFAGIRPQIQAIQRRLETFVNQAGGLENRPE